MRTTGLAAPVFQIGASAETIAAAREAILDILNANAEQQTIRRAFDAFVHVCETKNVTISHVNVRMDRGEPEVDEKYVVPTYDYGAPET